MGILKWMLKKFQCQSDCKFNTQQFIEDGLDCVDLSKYKLKKKDMINIHKIINKRPSVYFYKNEKMNTITEL